MTAATPVSAEVRSTTLASGSRLTGTTLKPVSKARTTGSAACEVCGSRLSAYNAGPNCYTHTVATPWKGPGQLPR